METIPQTKVCRKCGVAKSLSEFHVDRKRPSGRKAACRDCGGHVPHPPLAKRFWSKVDKDGPVHPEHGQCWVWTGCRNANGYGRFMLRRRLEYSHRVAWELSFGPIPDGLWVLHKCDNGRVGCVNPAHLFLGTVADNVADMVAKGRGAPPPLRRGEANGGGGKLTEADVRAIADEHAAGDLTIKAIARKYGVSGTMVGYIARRQSWRHLWE
jgi:HNH endonuclease